MTAPAPIVPPFIEDPANRESEAPAISAPPWPDPPAAVAFSGLAGEIVDLISPASEADRTALLAQLLVGFGAAVGRNPHFRVEGDRHGANLFALLVGTTSKGRKGTSWGQISRLLSEVEPDWTTHVAHGLSSGEGLIWAVRDPIVKSQAVKEKGRVVEYQDVIEDPGIADKRLLVIESEFARVLKVMARDGNTLSATVRQAWDSGSLRTMPKNSPAIATDSHIALIGHITSDEFRRHLDVTETANGFINRYLILAVHRSKCLPEGGSVHPADFALMAHALREAVRQGREVGEMVRTPTARRLWADVYPALSEGRTGLLGAVTSRAEAQALRLSIVYALLDGATAIDVRHLEAGLALWAYASASARYVFGDSLGDPVADQIMAALRRSDRGLTRTEISNLFDRHVSAGQMNRALGALMGTSMITMLKIETGGRPAESYAAAKEANYAK
jgi:hypothetical protein